MTGMRRAGRIVLNGLTGLSLILAVLVTVMWVRSYTSGEQVVRHGVSFTPVDRYSHRKRAIRFTDQVIL
jgi:hypothetical protein